MFVFVSLAVASNVLCDSKKDLADSYKESVEANIIYSSHCGYLKRIFFNNDVRELLYDMVFPDEEDFLNNNQGQF